MRKIYENFANYFLKTKANTKCFMVLKCKCKGLQKSICELERLNLSPRRCDTLMSTLFWKLMRLFISRLNLCVPFNIWKLLAFSKLFLRRLSQQIVNNSLAGKFSDVRVVQAGTPIHAIVFNRTPCREQGIL